MSDEGPSTPEFEVGKQQLTRRRLLATGAGGLAAMYGLGAARAGAAVPESLSDALGAGTVTLGSYETGPGIKALAAVTKKFTSNTGIGVKTNTVDHNTFQNQINSYLQGKPDDVFTWFAGYRMQFFAAKGLLFAERDDSGGSAGGGGCGGVGCGPGRGASRHAGGAGG